MTRCQATIVAASAVICAFAAGIYIAQSIGSHFEQEELARQKSIEQANAIINAALAEASVKYHIAVDDLRSRGVPSADEIDAAERLSMPVRTVWEFGIPDDRDAVCTTKYGGNFPYLNTARHECCNDGRSGSNCLQV